MTINEAEQEGECVDCIFRLTWKGPHQCMGTCLGETECPGRCGQEAKQPKEQNV